MRKIFWAAIGSVILSSGCHAHEFPTPHLVGISAHYGCLTDEARQEIVREGQLLDADYTVFPDTNDAPCFPPVVTFPAECGAGKCRINATHSPMSIGLHFQVQ